MALLYVTVALLSSDLVYSASHSRTSSSPSSISSRERSDSASLKRKDVSYLQSGDFVTVSKLVQHVNLPVGSSKVSKELSVSVTSRPRFHGGSSTPFVSPATPVSHLPPPVTRAGRSYRTVDPKIPILHAKDLLSDIDSKNRSSRTGWSIASSDSSSASSEVSDYYKKTSEEMDPYGKRYYDRPVYQDYNNSWWSNVHSGHPTWGWPGHPGGRRSYHKQQQQHPVLTAHWDEVDYGDYSAATQIVPVSHSYQHTPVHQHTPVYYVNEHKDNSWNDLTTKLIILAILKLLIAKALSFGAFKLFALGIIKLPIALGALALKFAFFVKFFKFIKVLIAVIVVPVIVVAIVPLLIPVFFVMVPLLLIPFLLLFPIPVIRPGGGAVDSGTTVVTVTPSNPTPGRRRRAEEEIEMMDTQMRILNSRRCLQKLACDVGYSSQSVRSYATWVMWLVGLLRPLLAENKRDQLKAYMAAYLSGLGGRSCYRKYPCYRETEKNRQRRRTNANAIKKRRAKVPVPVLAAPQPAATRNNATSA